MPHFYISTYTIPEHLKFVASQLIVCVPIAVMWRVLASVINKQRNKLQIILYIVIGIVLGVVTCVVGYVFICFIVKVVL